MVRILLFLFCILWGSHSYSDQQLPMIAVVDVQTILDQSTAVNGIRTAAEKINQELQTELNKKEMELKATEERIIQTRDTIPTEDFEQEIINFNKQVTAVQKSIQDKKVRLEQAHAKAISKVNDVALKIITELAAENKYYLILPSTQILYANEQLNITNQVLTALNAKIPSVELEF